MSSLKRELIVNRKTFQVNCSGGFTLVELMITVAILGILSAVAIPAYSNYMNRAKQSDAIIGLKAAQMAQEQYFSENNAYSSTIDILPGFDDSGSANNSYTKGEYTLSASVSSTATFVITATSSTLNDRWKIDESMIDPEADLNATYPGIKGYSVFGWIFD